MSNRDTWDSDKVVKYYSTKYWLRYHSRPLQPPEETIFNIFKDRFKAMKVLDIGVGGGRTTLCLAKVSKEYVGIDYSENMIRACKKRFSGTDSHISFKVCDVRSMKVFEDNYFDFILFSFNGIDYISHEDRLKSLQEIKRIVKKDPGYFVFSTHNIQNIDKHFSLGITMNPLKLAQRIHKVLRLRIANKDYKKLSKEKYALITDIDYQFMFETYYIKPKEQIRQLSGLGFNNISVYSLVDGSKIEDQSKLDTITDNWLYYLCNT